MKLPDRPDLIRDAIYKAAADRYEKPRNYLGCSMLGHPCERHIWYAFRQFPGEKIEGRVKLLFNLGHILEAEVISWLRRAGYEVDGQQDSFEALDGWLKGHCDGKIRHESLGARVHLLEIKSASKSAFEKFVKNGVKADPKYLAQLHLYMGFAGLERALFLMYCKDNSEIYSERVHFDRSLFLSLLKKGEKIIQANDLPEANEDYFQCKFCQYSLICKGGEPMATNGNCGSCKYHRFHGFRKACHHPVHPYFLETYDEGCPDYLYMWEKALPNAEPHWQAPVESVQEYGAGQ